MRLVETTVPGKPMAVSLRVNIRLTLTDDLH